MLFFPPKIVPCMKSCEIKYPRAGLATDDNAMERMRTECWIPTATDTHSECFPTVKKKTITRKRLGVT